MKWLMSKVLPGFDDVLAKALRLVSILIRLDLPTLDRPIKANSGLVSFGHILSRGEEIVYSAFFIIILRSILFLYKK